VKNSPFIAYIKVFVKLHKKTSGSNRLDICCQGYCLELHSKDFSRRSLFINKLLTKKFSRINFWTSCVLQNESSLPN